MEAWMITCLALLLGTIFVFIYNNVKTARTKQYENESFLAEAEDMLGFKISFSGKDDYETKLRTIFEEYKSTKNWTEDDFNQDSQITDPVDAWQRCLPDEKIKTLKAQLIRRMVNVLHQLLPFQNEYQTRFIMFQRGLLPERQWKQYVSTQQAIEREMLLIKFEAECLQENFGNEGTVFKEANKFFQHEVQKKKAEAQRQRLANLPPQVAEQIQKQIAAQQAAAAQHAAAQQAAARQSSGAKIEEVEVLTKEAEETAAEKARLRKMAGAMIEGASENRVKDVSTDSKQQQSNDDTVPTAATVGPVDPPTAPGGKRRNRRRKS